MRKEIAEAYAVVMDSAPAQTFEIEHSIPLPEANPNRGSPGESRRSKNKYPFADMQVGNSFLCTNRIQQVLSTAARAWVARRPGCNIRFETREVPDGVRVWRVQ